MPGRITTSSWCHPTDPPEMRKGAPPTTTARLSKVQKGPLTTMPRVTDVPGDGDQSARRMKPDEALSQQVSEAKSSSAEDPFADFPGQPETARGDDVFAP